MLRILFLLGVWLLISLAARMVLAGRDSAEATLKLLDARPDAAGSAEVRRAWITSISSRLAALDMDSRHLALMDPRLQTAFSEMSSEDQSYLLKATEPPNMGELIDASKQWSVGRCGRLLRPALADLEDLKTGSAARFQAMLVPDLATAEAAIGKIGIEGVFKGPTDPRTRFDVRPVIERIQKYSQRGR